MFYPHAVILRRADEEGTTEYPVDPADIAEALGAAVKLDSGLLDESILYTAQDGVKKLVVSYRPPGPVGLWIEGLDDPYRVNFPGLVLARVSKSRGAEYGLYAVLERPVSMGDELYLTPLPHVYDNGGICWGSVKRPRFRRKPDPVSLQADWDVLLGSRFGNHNVRGRSKKYPEDIRKLYARLDGKPRTQYPLDDLVEARKTFGNWVKGLL
jgi:hypothetical protein